MCQIYAMAATAKRQSMLKSVKLGQLRLRVILIMVGIFADASDGFRILRNGAVVSTVLNGHEDSSSKHDLLEIQETDILRSPEVGRAVSYRNSLADDIQLWPLGTIPYEISSSLGIFTRRSIADAITDFHNNTCIRWIERSNQEQWVQFYGGVGCYSYIGRQSVGPQQLSVGFNCNSKGTLIHEMMHVIGFFHEHNRIDRDAFVDIAWQNIVPGKSFNFHKNDGTDYTGIYGNTLGLRYDYGSVMHYGPRFFSVDGIRPTIIPKVPGVHIGQRLGLSDYDVEKINKLYNCRRPVSQTEETSTVDSQQNSIINPAEATTLMPASGSAVVGTIENTESQLFPQSTNIQTSESQLTVSGQAELNVSAVAPSSLYPDTVSLSTQVDNSNSFSGASQAETSQSPSESTQTQDVDQSTAGKDAASLSQQQLFVNNVEMKPTACVDNDSRCVWWAAGNSCDVYPGLAQTCPLSCNNCDGQKCSDTEVTHYKSLCQSIEAPNDPRCITEAFKTLCPRSCNYCLQQHFR